MQYRYQLPLQEIYNKYVENYQKTGERTLMQYKEQVRRKYGYKYY